ncbi:hypothetical protein NPIL_297881 [Nephila pilipes]|uniref:Uncharacterized protein n=1 Tax=Nephila pilipes TaxID=299642 RepID=A0A8X6QFT0_NEPPI|nr:hypothetical protein NPIL_297881 [Nephila pilipes]
MILDRNFARSRATNILSSNTVVLTVARFRPLSEFHCDESMFGQVLMHMSKHLAIWKASHQKFFLTQSFISVSKVNIGQIGVRDTILVALS